MAKAGKQQELQREISEMTDFAEKARQGRLVALSGIGNILRGGAGSSSASTRLRAVGGQDTVIFISCRGSRTAADLPL